MLPAGLSAEALWHGVTRLGESGIVLPLMLALAIGLGWSARRADRGLLLLLPIVLAAALVTATKIAFMGFGWGIAGIDFTRLSGHAKLAAAIYPVLAVALAPPTWPRRALALAAAAAIAVLVAVSRVAIGAHSESEVLGGCAAMRARGLLSPGCGLIDVPDGRVSPSPCAGPGAGLDAGWFTASRDRR